MYYTPYRRAADDAVRAAIERAGRCLHLSVHSFSAALSAKRSTCDVGVLYDPGRQAERHVAADLQRELTQNALRARRNYPYRGNTGGLTTALRRRFASGVYCGIELELNQTVMGSVSVRRRIADAIQVTASKTLAPWVRQVEASEHGTKEHTGRR